MMKKDAIIRLSLNDSLYNHQAFKGVFTYKVIGVREFVDSILYEIECTECLNHTACRLLVAQIDNLPQFKYVQMLNEDEDNEQYYWHSEPIYYISKNACKKAAYNKAVEYHKKEIAELKRLLKRQENSLAEIQSLIEGIKNEKV